jgi:hypothetical protein
MMMGNELRVYPGLESSKFGSLLFSLTSQPNNKHDVVVVVWDIGSDVPGCIIIIINNKNAVDVNDYVGGGSANTIASATPGNATIKKTSRLGTSLRR